ncbi:ATP-binding protein [Cytobacillus spongiae]|uniref:sensor histidine kinase n=1 Tax=Cytobacillus spongiae TaxID=2901381 RepID=UPI001F474286|nr:ATP-binding protein [Cytobacillus spongiae]UII55584.1 ATP-binding protein [Cytobacillus spongiae]
MIVGLLVCIIGIIPIVLAISTRRIFKGTELSFAVFIIMLLISIWQVDVGILYFHGMLGEEQTLFLFRLFRIAPTFSIPCVFFVVYTMLQNNPITFERKGLAKIFSKKVFYLLLGWSTFIYFMNWTSYGIKGLELQTLLSTQIDYYFPVYGPLHILFMLHMSTFIFFLTAIFLIARSLQNTYLKDFLKSFAINLVLLFIFGFFNFWPDTGAIASSFGVVLFSISIMTAFIKMNLRITLQYNQLMERQKKMDYIGNLVSSLTHEVKNTAQVIRGFSQMLEESTSNPGDQAKLKMIQKATDQIHGFSDQFKEYIESSKMDFRIEDLNQIISDSIDFSKEQGLDISYRPKYKPLTAYVNKAFLQQVFMNLIKNSAEAMADKDRDRTITIRTEVEKGFVLIHFFDKGKGIPASCWESIFDPFFSLKESGMGMGLPFVKKIIFEHRGDVRVVSSDSKGTHFLIQIPQNELSDFI